ncbi:TIGR03560 family F420-dependent LLM class oxidoreductase [bacterium]|nr:TIGR03560 family F420-dependent LLM class oxidoreductase [bacterium]
MALRFGIHTGQQHTSFGELLALWQHAESIGLDWASVFDHFIPIFSDPEGPCFEGFSVLSALAAGTKKLRCGMIVSGVTYRNPVLLAKAATTIDHVSNGRMELGLGAAWFELEHQQYNFPFPSVGTRMDMLEEACEVITSLFKQERTTFEGKHFSVKDALFLPKPVHGSIPLWIGGGGEKRTLRAVARYADGWNYFLTSPEDYRRKLGFLEEHCRDSARRPEDIRKALIVRAILDQGGQAPDEQTYVGSADGLAEKLKPFVDLGVEDFLLLARPPADHRTLDAWACEVRSILTR